MEPTCPKCHTAVRATDYFCFNCGANLHPKPLPTNLTTELMYYAGSILLPPLGFWWGVKYIQQPGAASKRIAILCMVLTTVSLIISSVWLVNYFNKLNAQVNQQLNGLQGF